MHANGRRKSTFSAASYATFRPTYPPSLYQSILSFHRGPRKLCIDLGCGHGLVARHLSQDFEHVVGTDPSKGMIAQAQSSTPAEQYPNVEFREATAEDLAFVEAGSVDLVVAAQAAHWFDYPRLWPELKRVLRQGGTMAFFGYKDHVFVESAAATRLLHENSWRREKDALGYYWQQPGRSIVEAKLRPIEPPTSIFDDITRIEYEPGTNGPGTGEGTMFVSKRLTIANCKNYVRTWSSYHGWKDAHPGAKARKDGGQGDVVDELFDQIAVEEPSFRDENKEVDLEWGSGLLMARKK
jgi:trans-aconitate 3-methyltransferase